MKFPKLVKITRKILNDNQDASRERKENLKEIQRKLKKKAKQLKEKLDREENEEVKKSILQKLSVVTAQRKKVIDELRKLDREPLS